MSTRTRRIAIGFLVLSIGVAALLAFLMPSPILGGGAPNPNVKPSTETTTTLFLYAITTSGSVETYSPLHGKIRVFGDVLKSGAAAEQTITGKPAACVKLAGGSSDPADPNTLPFLYWIDIQGMEQQQFFTTGQVVYVCDQPLVENPNGSLGSELKPSVQS